MALKTFSVEETGDLLENDYWSYKSSAETHRWMLEIKPFLKEDSLLSPEDIGVALFEAREFLENRGYTENIKIRQWKNFSVVKPLCVAMYNLFGITHIPVNEQLFKSVHPSGEFAERPLEAQVEKILSEVEPELVSGVYQLCLRINKVVRLMNSSDPEDRDALKKALRIPGKLIQIPESKARRSDTTMYILSVPGNQDKPEEDPDTVLQNIVRGFRAAACVMDQLAQDKIV